jgi:hypothetical protein
MPNMLNDLESEDSGPVKPLLEHLEDLRNVIIKIVLVLIVSCIVCGYFAPKVLNFLTYPLEMSGLQDPNGKQFLTVLNPSTPFSLPFTLAFYAGIVLASPFIFYFLGSFILPALTSGLFTGSAVFRCWRGCLLFLSSPFDFENLQGFFQLDAFGNECLDD